MVPPIEGFPASQLRMRVQLTVKGKLRKGETVDLRQCELLEMVQYSCQLERGQSPGAMDVVRCMPIVKLFRR